jgi:hypothetical protein
LSYFVTVGHSLLTVYIERAIVDEVDGFVQLKHGKVVFVDLAGSEREAHSGVQGEAAKETRNINLSLLSLVSGGSCACDAAIVAVTEMSDVLVVVKVLCVV